MLILTPQILANPEIASKMLSGHRTVSSQRMSRERLLALEVVRTYQRYAMINVIIYCRSVIQKYFEIEESRLLLNYRF